MMVALLVLVVLSGELATKNASGFSQPSLSSRTRFSSNIRRITRKDIHIYQTYDDEDEPELVDKLLGDEFEEDLLKFDMKFTPKEMDELRAKLQNSVIDSAINADLEQISKLRKQLAEEAVASKSRMNDAMSLNAQYETQNFLEKVDRMTEEFLESNREFRETTKRIADVDQMAGASGRGVDWGSWGTIGGMDVVVGGVSDMPGRLLGSIDSARRRGETIASTDGAYKPILSKNRIMVVSDEQKVNIIDRI
jgi:hypothetical protein